MIEVLFVKDWLLNQRPKIDPLTGHINLKYDVADIYEDYYFGISLADAASEIARKIDRQIVKDLLKMGRNKLT